MAKTQLKLERNKKQLEETERKKLWEIKDVCTSTYSDRIHPPPKYFEELIPKLYHTFITKDINDWFYHMLIQNCIINI